MADHVLTSRACSEGGAKLVAVRLEGGIEKHGTDSDPESRGELF